MMFRALLCLLILSLTLTPARADDNPVLATLFEKDIRFQDFERQLKLMRQQLNPKFSRADLWQRLVYLRVAERESLKVSSAQIDKGVEEVIRGHWLGPQIEALKRQHRQQTGRTLPAKTVAEKQRQLLKGWSLTPSIKREFLEGRSLTEEALRSLVRDNLLVEALLVKEAKTWNSERLAKLEKREYLGVASVDIYEFDARPFEAQVPEPSEAELKRLWAENRRLFRRPDKRELRFLARPDDGSFTLMQGLHKQWQQQPTLKPEDLAKPHPDLIFGSTGLERLDQLVLPLFLKHPSTDHWIHKARRLQLSFVMRVPGYQVLLKLNRAEKRRTWSFAEARSRGLIAPLWRQQQSLLPALREAQRALRFQRLKTQKRGSLRLFNVSKLPSKTAFPKPLLKRARAMSSGQRCLHLSLDQRRVYLMDVVQRLRPLVDLVKVEKDEVARKQREQALRWRTQLMLRSKGVTPELQEYLHELTKPRCMLRLRVLPIPAARVHSASVTAARALFQKGLSLKMLAQRLELKLDPVKTWPQHQNLFAAALGAKPLSLSAPITWDKHVHSLLTQTWSKHGDQEWRRVFHSAMPAADASLRTMKFLEIELKSIRDRKQQLKRFRQMARQNSIVPSRHLGGLCGLLAVPRSAKVRVVLQALSSMNPGDLSVLKNPEGGELWLRVLETRPLSEQETLTSAQRLDHALPWEDRLSWARRR